MIRVLVADDESVVRKGIINGTDWQLIGCEVVAEAANGEEGLEKALDLKPDLVVSDIRMPKMDGLEMVRQIMESLPKIKVIFLTAYGDFKYAQQAIKLGACDYILKPFEDGELEAAIQRLIQQNILSQGSIRAEDLIPLKRASDIENRYIRNAIEYIEQHYSEPGITIAQIADALALSEGYLSRLFKSETEYSINTYITRYRILTAAKLLDDVQNKVYEVAEKVGYLDITYFSTTFKKLAGVTPSQYQSRGI
ncbi:MAG: response regulator [Lachnospiraceae bacterium]|nr:response regulator [Lachnospiraceae bacterium]